MGAQAAEESATEALEVFKDQMVALIPALRAFARGLCRNRDLADDLVQDAMMRAWASRSTFTPGTNFRAWMFKILRNNFYTTMRKNARHAVWDPEAAERILVEEPAQDARINVEDINKALQLLPDHQRETLLLIAGAGLSYEEVAVVSECNIGTVKSRLNRGRAALKEILDGAAHPDAITRQMKSP
ncbi:MAG: sigma-70 family RNA polymerase sigma factor [Erythrobacter sp.]